MLRFCTIGYQEFPSQGIRLATVKLLNGHDAAWCCSMIHPIDDGDELYYRPYATRQEALEGHAKLAATINNGTLNLGAF